MSISRYWTTILILSLGCFFIGMLIILLYSLNERAGFGVILSTLFTTSISFISWISLLLVEASVWKIENYKLERLRRLSPFMVCLLFVICLLTLAQSRAILYLDPFFLIYRWTMVVVLLIIVVGGLFFLARFIKR